MHRMTAILSSVLCVFGMSAQTTIPERLNHVLEVQDMNEGLKLYNEISEPDIAQFPDSVQFDYHYLGGYLNSELPDHDKALKHLLEAKRLCEKSLGIYSIGYMDIMHGLGDEYISLGRYDDALATFEEGIVKTMAIRNGAPNAFGNLIMGVQECYEYKGWLNEVPVHLMDAWSFWPKTADSFEAYSYYPLWCLEQFYVRYELYDDAIKINDAIINFISDNAGSRHTEMAEALYLRGNVFYKMEKYSDAVDAYRKGLSILAENSKTSDEMNGMLLGNLLSATIQTDKWQECDIVLGKIKDYGAQTGNANIYKNALFSAAKDLNAAGHFSKAVDLNAILISLPLSDAENNVVNNQTNEIRYNQEVIQKLPQLENLFMSGAIGTDEWFEAGHQLSSAYFIQKELDKNISVLVKMHDTISLENGRGQDYFIWTLRNLYGSCIDSGDYKGALRYSNEYLNYLQSIPDAPKDYLYYALNDLVVAKLRSNSLDGIEADMAKVESYTLDLFGRESNEYSVYLHNHGRALQLQGKLNDAKGRYVMAINLQSKISGSVSPRTVQYLSETEKQLIDEELGL